MMLRPGCRTTDGAKRLFRAIVVIGSLVASEPVLAEAPMQSARNPATTYGHAMQGWMQARGVAHASIAVMRDDRLVFAKGYGDRGANQRIGVWSLSKAITAACIATLVQERRLRFDDPIGPLLAPVYAKHGRPIDARVERISVAQLIAHRGGFSRVVGGNRFAPGVVESLRLHPPAEITVAHLLPKIQALQLAREPGSGYEYSNVGYLLLGQIVEAVTGRSYESECGARVLARAGIKSPTLHPAWGRLAHSSAGWSLSGPEYLAFARLLRPQQVAVLNPETHTRLHKFEGHWIDGERQRAYTLGVQLYLIPNARPTIYHGGGWVWAQADAKGGPIDEINWTYFVMAGDGTAWFASFQGKRGDEEREVFDHLDSALWQAKRQTTSWPARDLFPAMGVGPVSRK
jgi:CubicO group peptidase (beta-lactamase class C family)